MESKIVDLIFSFTVKPEDQVRYEQIVTQQLAITQNEPHVLSYEIFRQADGTYCQHERYADEAAIRLHMQNTAEPLGVWNEITTLTQLIVLGPVGEDFRQEFGTDNYSPYRSVTH